MSSFGRTFIPIGLAVAFGMFNGYYVFAPMFREQQKGSQLPITKSDQETNMMARLDDSTQHQPSDTDISSNR
ncbi:hypothetical protein F4781DRAFT_413424 [Annulohypoxylon bovei var. microspora]|nr:hypothetical protein F4781DRAFT_413424 [Annulohypoxylon bovei var. microspora]